MSPSDDTQVSQKKSEEDISIEMRENIKHAKDNDDDVEHFDGQIVYNPDGSAYIIEDSDLSDEQLLEKLPRQEDGITEENGDEDKVPKIVYIGRNNYHSNTYDQSQPKMVEGKDVPGTPIVHNFKVYSVRNKNIGDNKKESGDPECSGHTKGRNLSIKF